ncbi:MAG: flavin reductase family protein [Myxococcota bacterium]|nr:flavin reductase family protein [Myxococcota bacterium]
MAGIDGEEFRECLARWASGVTVVTSRAGEDIHGMTVSDFSGTSLDPPLVTICCARESMTTELIGRGGCFAVNILAADQEDLSNQFASKKHEMERFVGVEFDQAETGAPMIAGCLANLDCELVATHEAGDHLIYVGRIMASRWHNREPLIYWGGGYRRLKGLVP